MPRRLPLGQAASTRTISLSPIAVIAITSSFSIAAPSRALTRTPSISIAPVAGTRMTEDLFPAEAFAAFAPEKVMPAALFLVSEDAPSNAIIGAGAGVFQASYVTLTQGKLLAGDDLSPEGVAAHWEQITDRSGEIVPQSGAEQGMLIGKLLMAG